jgi:hypothetical protein
MQRGCRLSKKCDICDSEHYTQKHGKSGLILCNKHRKQLDKYGHILPRTRVDANEIKILDDWAEMTIYNKAHNPIAVALIDIDDVIEISKHRWCLTTGKYVMTKINRKTLKLHRFILSPPENMEVDHINHNKLDNRRSNLRIVTKSQNQMNSKAKGVYWSSVRQKWFAGLTKNKKSYTKGYFNDIQDAIRVRRELERVHFGEFAYKEGEYNS